MGRGVGERYAEWIWMLYSGRGGVGEGDLVQWGEDGLDAGDGGESDLRRRE